MRPILGSISLVLAILAALGAWYLLRPLGNAALRGGPFAESLLFEGALVDDRAGLFTQAEQEKLSEYHATLLGDYDIDYRVASAKGLADISATGVALLTALAEYSDSRQGRLLLLLIDPERDSLRLEVGYGLEGAFPDAFAAYVEERQMVPFFRNRQIANGILATTELIVERARREALGLPDPDLPDQEAHLQGGGGAGAETHARIGEGTEIARTTPAALYRFQPGKNPEETLARYLSAMADGEVSPELPLYTDASRAMLRGWTITPAQRKNMIASYRSCSAESARLGSGGRRAVIRYPQKERSCAPWFFEKGPKGWELDLTMMQSAIRFGRTNAWRFDLTVPHPYSFAFEDWAFDGYGFPKVP
jgi:uncharacterized protein